MGLGLWEVSLLLVLIIIAVFGIVTVVKTKQLALSTRILWIVLIIFSNFVAVFAFLCTRNCAGNNKRIR